MWEKRLQHEIKGTYLRILSNPENFKAVVISALFGQMGLGLLRVPEQGDHRQRGHIGH